ncbi:MAG: HtaA domain-containing protein [Pseudoclavibacter sp.]
MTGMSEGQSSQDASGAPGASGASGAQGARRAPDARGESRGELRWAVKASFVGYIRSSGGAIEVLGGARDDDGEFVFARATDGVQFDGDAPRGAAKFAGSVRFTAHGGMLDLTIADPEIAFGPHGASLFVRGGDGLAVELATLDVGGPLERDSVLEWIGVTPTLTDAGSTTFNGAYPSGSDLDALSFQLAR